MAKTLPRFEFSRESLENQFNCHATFYKLSETPQTRQANLKLVDALLDVYNETPARRQYLASKREAEVFGEVS